MGGDVVTTIDVNIQDVAEHALRTQLIKHNANHGCAVLMEVETGEVKAIANLTRKEEGVYLETYNYAIGESTEPGSTFKLASVISMLDDGLASPLDSVDTEDGTTKFFDRTMKDSHHGGNGKVTLKHGFELSSNVAISKLVYQHYSKDPQKFIDRLYAMNLQEPLGLEIPGETPPNIKNTKDKEWSRVSLPWMSIGYELRITPLQMLTFYNAVANNGKMVKPIFIKEIRKRGHVEKKIETTVINPQICSMATVEIVKTFMEGVVEYGTATNLRNSNYKIAGKTGTAQMAKEGGYKGDSKVIYQASFVGYFPADKPRYSCIVVVNEPSDNGYYGNIVAGPVFTEIANKVYYTRLDMHKELTHDSLLAQDWIPESKLSFNKEIKKALDIIKIPNQEKEQTGDWVLPVQQPNILTLSEQKEIKGLIPNVVGMGAKDAIFMLENQGLLVKITGCGTVKKQSIQAGTMINKGTQIVIELS